MNVTHVVVVGSVFERPGREGDFTWMLAQPENDHALFLFNDNEEQFREHRDHPQSPRGCAAGGGNAAIRPWQCKTPPRAAGIPTGSAACGGYPSLTPAVQAIVDDALVAIRKLLASGEYRKVYYSSDGQGGLGTGIFQVGDDVKEYILTGIKALGVDAPTGR